MAELRVPASMEQHRQVMDFVEDFSHAAGAGEANCMRLLVAVDELFTNIAQYGYPDGRAGTADIIATEDNGVITITFVDDGIPYDPLAREDPDITLSAEERKIGGLGIFMVKKTMDRMDYAYENGKNRLTLQLKIR